MDPNHCAGLLNTLKLSTGHAQMLQQPSDQSNKAMAAGLRGASYFSHSKGIVVASRPVGEDMGVGPARQPNVSRCALPHFKCRWKQEKACLEECSIGQSD